MVMKNPFVTNGYAGPEYFCDRVEETQHITEMLTNENNMALISPRRIGKTELIHHCFAQPVIQKDYYTFIIDIYSTNSVSDLVNMFGKAIIDELRPKGRSAWEKFLIALSSLSPFRNLFRYQRGSSLGNRHRQHSKSRNYA